VTIARISYGNSVLVSRCLSRPGTVRRPGEIKISVVSPYDSLESLVFREKFYAAG